MAFPISFRRSAARHLPASVAAGMALLGLSAAAAEPVKLARPDAAPPSKDQMAVSFKSDVKPIFETYCYDCHGDGSKKGELAMDKYADIDAMIADRDTWKRIRDHIDFRLMPPPDEDAPTDVERGKMLTWIDDAVFPVDPKNPDPGHVTLRRFNRTEYKNTIRDLLGVNVDVDEILPADDSGYGFDNIGDVLTLSPVHLERYLDAARVALDKAIDLGPLRLPQRVVNGQDFKGGGNRDKEGYYFFANGEAAKEFNMAAGRYKIQVRAGAEAVAKEPAKMVLKVNGAEEHQWSVSNSRDKLETYESEFRVGEVKSGSRLVLAFTNDFYDAANPDPKQRDRNLLVKQVVIEGPLDGPMAPRPETHRRIYGERAAGQTDDAYMLDVLNKFARRAFRRPAEAGEIERYLAFNRLAKSQGKTVEEAIRNALEAMLVSPSFLFREEPGIGLAKGGRKLISEHALAARLSYFLWSTMPDDQLFKLASTGKLRENLGPEITRMIADPKAEAFTSNFAGQWLQLRNLSGAFPNRYRFPSFYDDRLAPLMRKETEMLFENVLKENLPVTTLLTADYTFVNDKLANHYGLPDVKGGEFRKVSLAGTARRGIFGHGSFLTLTSYPNRTSPVLRGQYVLENILHTPAPPPPPNVPQLTAAEGHKGSKTSLREQMEKHREDPGCASCHALMDPIGFGMENFDAVGRWRDKEGDLPVNAAGTLVTGQSFAGPSELMKIISTDNREAFHRALAEKLLTYALGRGVDWYDRPAVDGIVMKTEAGQGRFVSLIQAVVTSVPFQYRRD